MDRIIKRFYNIENQIYDQLWLFLFLKQFKEWKFYMFGVGLYPRPIETERITTILGLQASVMIHFKNPTSEDVSVDLILTSRLFFLHFIDMCLFHYKKKFYEIKAYK